MIDPRGDIGFAGPGLFSVAWWKATATSTPTPQPTVTHGKQARFYLTVNGSLTDVSSYLTAASMQRTTAPQETTQLGTNTKHYIPGYVTETKLTFDGLFDPTMGSAIESTTGHTNFAYYPAGTATGQYKFSGTADFTAKVAQSNTAKANEISGELNMTGRPVVTLL